MSLLKRDRSEPADRPLSVVLSEFSQFFDSALGDAMLSAEKTRLARELAHLVGYNGIQLSVLRGQQLLCEESVGQAVALGYSLGNEGADDILADFQELPIAHECADVLLLHHVLEFTSDPTQLLREANRVVKPGGHIIVFSYNLFSAWPLYIRYWLWKSGVLGAIAPSVRQGRLHDWLMALNYDIVASDKMCARLPINHSAWVQRMKGVERFLDRISLPLGMVSFTVACKRSQPVNPLLSPDWKQIFKGKPHTVARRNSANSTNVEQRTKSK